MKEHSRNAVGSDTLVAGERRVRGQGTTHTGGIVETTLFDQAGHAVCYVCDDNENTIYLWSGHAVACVDDEAVYGWNGRHLGFFVDGVMYDTYGQRVGTTAGKCLSASCFETAKNGKFAKGAKYEKGAERTRPSFSWKYSSQALEDFLLQGATGNVASGSV